ncbi:MAG: UDP-N-acetylmuramate--L-alanine ligase [Patescibacteria group bacterium]|jgi:UDP-N-acetylmuramate--alanine ligase
MTYHLIGIRGSAMSGVAALLRAQGHVVRGSDLSETGHRATNITSDIDRVVYTPAVTPGSPGWVELEAAKRVGIPALRLDEMQAELTKDATLMAVTGTHGKSSTTAMLAHVLEVTGRNPSVLLGAPIPAWEGRNYRVGNPSLWVVEADEYKRKFLTLSPTVAVITNVEFDHADVYRDLADVESAFAAFVDRVRPGGTVIAHAEPAVDVVLGRTPEGVSIIRYGAQYDYRPELLPKLRVLGDHQRLNATAVLAAAEVLGVSREDALTALGSFGGVGRRLEYIGERDGVIVYDDYGHHPTEVRASLAAFRSAFPDRRRVVAFQPHQHSRVHALFAEFAAAFGDADKVLLADVYAVPGRNEGIEVDAGELADAIRGHGVDVIHVGSLESLTSVLRRELRPGDAFLTVGATDITNVGRVWVSEGSHGTAS